ncbi:MAG: NPCBM/NEW2 domain-containing protein [Archaeoglobus sp.]|nr:NPCBM/NEW2 domain-containing protein [Archaeoglobus sp.]
MAVGGFLWKVKVFPATDIRSLDLFPLHRSKRVIDLKVDHLGRSYDVVGCFNFDSNEKDILYIDFASLGLDKNVRYHVFDFWSKEYLGAWDKGYFAHIQPSSAVVLTLMKMEDYPQLISTDRHITQGWVDLMSLDFDKSNLEYKGESKVIKGDPYEMYFVYPLSKNYAVERVKAKGVEVEVENYQGWSVVRLKSSRTREVEWSVRFKETGSYSYPVRVPRKVVMVKPISFDAVKIVWEPTYRPNCGYCVYYGGEKLGVTPLNEVIIRGIDIEKKEVEVSCVWYDGRESDKRLKIELSYDELFPDEVFLSDVEPVQMTSGWGVPKMNRSLSGDVLRIGDNKYEKGIGTHAVSDIVYRLKRQYSRLVGEVGMDYHSYVNKSGSITFEVYGDGKLLWSSGVVRYNDSPVKLEVDITGVDELRIHVGDAGDGISYDHANLCNLKVMK